MPDLLNWLWQGCLIALTADVALRFLQRLRARDRYTLCGIAVLAVLALPILSVLQIEGSPMDPSTTTRGTILVSTPTAWWTSGTLIIALWSIWCTVCGLRVVGALVATGHARRHCRPLPQTLESRLHHWRAARWQGRSTRVVTSDCVRSAAVLGCGAPVIAVSPTLARNLSADDLDCVILHEWAHVQRRDDLHQLAIMTIGVLAGWHPAIWWLDRHLRSERESACDEMVIAVTGSPKSYAASLTTTAELVQTGVRIIHAATLGAVPSSGLGDRVIRILSQTQLRSRRWSTILATGAVAGLCAGAVSIAGLRIAAPAVLASTDPVASTVASLPVVPSPVESGIGRFRADRSDVGMASRERPQIATRESGHLTDEPPLSDTPSSVPFVIAADPVAPLDSRPMTGLLPADADPTLVVTLSGAAAQRIAVQPRLVERSASPWSAAADAGVVIGTRSQDAAVATAGFFTRFGRKLAASF